MTIRLEENKEMEIRGENYAFRRIRPTLEKLGWRYVEKYVTWFEYRNSLNIVSVSALKLENNGTVIALIPRGSGIEISNESVPGPRNFHNRFLNNLFYFLIENNITEIYRPLYGDDDCTSPEDRADYETELVKCIKKRAFAAEEDSNKARLDVKSFLEQYDLGDVDYSLLSKSFMDRVSSIVEETVEVSFEFSDNEDKNFTVDYQFEDYDTIRRKVNDLIRKMPKDNQSNLILKTLFAPTFESESEITDEERELIQQAFGNVLEQAADSENYRQSVRQIGFLIVGTFHYQINGIENGINGYQLVLDQNSHSLQINPFKTT